MNRPIPPLRFRLAYDEEDHEYQGDAFVFELHHRGGEYTYVVARFAANVISTIPDWNDNPFAPTELPATIDDVDPRHPIGLQDLGLDLVAGVDYPKNADEDGGVYWAPAAAWAQHFEDRGELPHVICSTAWRDG